MERTHCYPVQRPVDTPQNRLLESAGELTNHGTFLDAELPEFRPAGGQAKASRLAFKHEGMHDACEDRDGMIIIGRNAHT